MATLPNLMERNGSPRALLCPRDADPHSFLALDCKSRLALFLLSYFDQRK